jgi:hypothetical protein
MANDFREQAEGYFGWCPHCRNNDGYVNAGSNHWFVCNEHKTRWCTGSNLFSSWKEETAEQQRKIWEEGGFYGYAVVHPVYPPVDELRTFERDNNKG